MAMHGYKHTILSDKIIGISYRHRDNRIYLLLERTLLPHAPSWPSIFALLDLGGSQGFAELSLALTIQL